ncbi:glycoside hydrolase family 73 protein [Paenibacillus sp. NPDC056579]|uniref:glycoside hydrolase family 73 protein n=1 Tax=Paenibacillus sp. NPDC056579 TaxID=3345871 RepID=UPI003673AF77
MDPRSFIDFIAPYAMNSMRQSGILASVTIAQAALESGWGNFAAGNNLFGIKGEGQVRDTQEYIDGRWITIKDGFRVYDSWEDSIRDHAQFLLRNARYAAVIGERDYRQASTALQQAGYATDPLYAQKLIRIIESWQLYQYDELVWRGNGYVLSEQDANRIIGFLSAAWHVANDDKARDEFHRLANELRKASGQPEQ